jgi:transcriptional regulator with XRE-family HTH domain
MPASLFIAGIYPIRYTFCVDPGQTLKRARHGAALSQSELARRAGTSQATISAYESGAKEPSLSTLERLLAVTGHSLDVREEDASHLPSRAEIERRGRVLAEVLGLAEALPARRRGKLAYPTLPTLTGG